MSSRKPRASNAASLFVLFLGLALLFPAAALAAEETSSLAATIADHLKVPTYNEFDAERAFAEWGEGCVPILIQMLNESSGEAEKVAFYLGKTKSSAAVHPLIQYVERLLAAGSERRFGYLALGWIGDENALAYLAQAAKDPRRSEQAVHGLEVAENRAALALLEQLDRELGANRPKYLPEQIARCREAIERREGLQRARGTERSGEDLAKFWGVQSVRPVSNPKKEILCKYTGSVFRSDYPKSLKLDGVRFEFRKDGSFETNWPLSDRPSRLLTEFAQGRYRVLSPTQLVLGPGKGVTTFAFSLSEGRLSFYHGNQQAFFSLAKNSPLVSPYTPASIAGVYKGQVLLAREEPNRLEPIDGIEIVFSDNGYFSTNFGGVGGRFGRNAEPVDGKYLIDRFGKLVCFREYHGSDVVGGTVTSFFDWHLRDGALRANYGSWPLALSLSGNASIEEDKELLKQLTAGKYTGSAFRATPDGAIVELPGIELTFREDGTYQCNFSTILREERDQYYPEDEGPFRLFSDRQLYMADKWKGDDVTNQGVCDVLLSGDKLYFTSRNRKAYFTLKQERP